VNVSRRRPSQTFAHARRPASGNLQGTKPRERVRIGTSPHPKPGWNQEKRGGGVLPPVGLARNLQPCAHCHRSEQIESAAHVEVVALLQFKNSQPVRHCNPYNPCGRPRLRCAALPAPFSSSNWYDGGRDFRCSMNTDRPALRITRSESDPELTCRTVPSQTAPAPTKNFQGHSLVHASTYVEILPDRFDHWCASAGRRF
jgi:hypothetical protein